MSEVFDVKTATTKALIEFYNSKTGKSIKKFSSRAAGEKQCAALLDKDDGTKRPANPLSAQVESLVKHNTSARTESAKPASKVSRSKAIAASWSDPATCAARSEKHHVMVGAVEYRSVKDAFEKLGLPLGKHIKFRAELKAKGKHTLDGHVFTVVEKS